MCNEVARRIALGIIREDFNQLRIPLLFPEGLPNLAPEESIRITDRAALIRMGMGAAAGPEMVVRRWSWPGPTGKPVFNFRSEGRRLAVGRCLIPVDAMFEFTPGAGKRKDKWRFEAADALWFAIAGLWRIDAKVGEAFTMLTCEPGADIAPYHSRQVAVLDRRDWAAWLDPANADAARLIAPSAAGSFRVTAAG